MKNKTLIIIIILLAVALALAVGFYFAKERGLFSDRSGDVAFPDNGPGRPAEEGQDLLQTEEFFVNIPDG
ncbi:hypothetical protein KJ969_03265, partial [Patescibacteria group bacterium]|nr:hypothetical protein [Patescibacteria group bacterium]MBU1921699.1 hypothetical protein [Patescibacteria group bacterium]